MKSRMIKSLLLCVLCVSVVYGDEQTKVSLNVTNVPVVEAFQNLFTGTGKSYLLAPTIPADQRITAVLQNISFTTALNVLCESAGLSWRQEDGVYVIAQRRAVLNSPATVNLTQPNLGSSRLSRSAPPLSLHVPSGTAPLTLSRRNSLGGVLPPMSTTRPAILALSPTLSVPVFTFTCPHCKKTATKTTAPVKCAKCGQTLQSGWTFCPYDGTEKPKNAQSEWKHCPFCGKEVK